MRLRDVVAVRDTAAFVPPSLLVLARWVAEYYLAGPGDVLATALPPRVLTGDERTFRRRRMAALTAAGLHAAQQAAIGPRCAPPGDDGADALRLGRRQREALVLLAGAPAGLATTALADRGITAATVARLVQTGLVVMRHEAVDRDPFDAHALVPASGGILTLTDEQRQALDVLLPLADRRTFQAALVRGVTGSGKTEIYLHLADHVRRQGRQALVLVPEIALTPAVAGRVRARFGDRVAIQHSGLSDGERHDQWHRVRGGDVDVVVGTRSAVFAPLDRLGLVVVDEEHDTSYKQDEAPRYHGRDVAVMRAHQAGALAVLGSATPSLETFHNASRGRYTAVTLVRRVADRPLAAVRVVNMREEWAEAGQEVILSRALATAIGRAAGGRRAEPGAAQPPRGGGGGPVPTMWIDGRVSALQRLDDGARRRWPGRRPLPLLRLRRSACRRRVRTARRPISSTSASAPSASRPSCARGSRPRASAASTATRSAGAAASRRCWRASDGASSTCSSARR